MHDGAIEKDCNVKSFHCLGTLSPALHLNIRSNVSSYSEQNEKRKPF